MCLTYYYHQRPLLFSSASGKLDALTECLCKTQQRQTQDTPATSHLKDKDEQQNSYVTPFLLLNSNVRCIDFPNGQLKTCKYQVTCTLLFLLTAARPKQDENFLFRCRLEDEKLEHGTDVATTFFFKGTPTKRIRMSNYCRHDGMFYECLH